MAFLRVGSGGGSSNKKWIYRGAEKYNEFYCEPYSYVDTNYTLGANVGEQYIYGNQAASGGGHKKIQFNAVDVSQYTKICMRVKSDTASFTEIGLQDINGVLGQWIFLKNTSQADTILVASLQSATTLTLKVICKGPNNFIYGIWLE